MDSLYATAPLWSLFPCSIWFFLCFTSMRSLLGGAVLLCTN
ncbi:hypothetical protein SLEP1_g54301 [Rubroshorea leprosula]|uniref:Uncharacterized protein n=1 Tax=Rubroshorea leprosula TaxID=152421 RepID=A0AAV5MEF2_9ROSI|nr:hypothetical protein SLEP1_g54301 [Rubroshorea leprosula]